MKRETRHALTTFVLIFTCGFLLPTSSCSFDSSRPGTADVTTEDTGQPVDMDTDNTNTMQHRSCDTNEECVDSLTCTTEICGDQGFCVWVVADGSCLINAVCYEVGDISPNNPCLSCSADDNFNWSALDDDTECNDGNMCTNNNTCQSGVCSGDTVTCDDSNGCAENVCDPDEGCVLHPINEGNPCELSDMCVADGVCFAGECAGHPVNCDDGDPCTDDACNAETGCVWVNNIATCEDGDACTIDDVCAEGVCTAGQARNCEDGNTCTVDACDRFAGCVAIPTESPCCIGEVSICDDGDTCTNDLCDPDTLECDHEDNTAMCEDESMCTRNDECFEGDCIGQPIACEDNNPCTENQCLPGSGCAFPDLNEGVCDDGVDCTTDTVCVEGACLGDESGCFCDPVLYTPAIKFTNIAIGEGMIGGGLDLDDDPDTCRPDPGCIDGIDNSMAALGPVVNESLAESLTAGTLILIIEFRDYSSNPFDLAAFDAVVDPEDVDCSDVQTDVCDYIVNRDLFDLDTCEPIITLEASITGEDVTAGGPSSVFRLQFPFGDAMLDLTVYQAQIVGALTTNPSAGDRFEFDGILAGAVKLTELIDALYALPADALPVPASAIESVINMFVVEDIDTNDDDIPDAASIGLPVSGIEAVLIGAE